MNDYREPIEVALLALFQAKATFFTTCDRKARLYPNVPPEEQPSLSINKDLEKRTHKVDGQIIPNYLFYNIICYDQVDVNAIPATIVNTILANVEFAISSPTAKQTLGGLCENVFIDGETTIRESIIGTQVIVIIPLVIRTAVI